MFCGKCGKQLDDGILFCKYCGTKIVNISENNTSEENDSKILDANMDDKDKTKDDTKTKLNIKSKLKLKGKLDIKTILERLRGKSGNKSLDNLYQIVNISMIIFALANIVAFFLPIFAKDSCNIIDYIKLYNKYPDIKEYKDIWFSYITVVVIVLDILVCAERFIEKINIWFLAILVGALDIVWLFNYTSWIPYADYIEMIFGIGAGTILYMICAVGMVLTGIIAAIISNKMKTYTAHMEYYAKVEREGKSKLL